MNQDWNVVVFNPKETEKKRSMYRVPLTDEQIRLKKIAQSEEAEYIKTIPKDLSKRIQRARNDKEMTQRQLAARIFESVSVVADYENGKAIPHSSVLGKMEKILDVKLRGKYE